MLAILKPVPACIRCTLRRSSYAIHQFKNTQADKRGSMCNALVQYYTHIVLEHRTLFLLIAIQTIVQSRALSKAMRMTDLR